MENNMEMESIRTKKKSSVVSGCRANALIGSKIQKKEKELPIEINNNS